MCLVLFHDRGMGNLFSLTAFFITRIRWLPWGIYLKWINFFCILSAQNNMVMG
jgi:hypothetical protein